MRGERIACRATRVARTMRQSVQGRHEIRWFVVKSGGHTV